MKKIANHIKRHARMYTILFVTIATSFSLQACCVSVHNQEQKEKTKIKQEPPQIQYIDETIEQA